MAKYDGLLYVPATDLNFISGIQGLNDKDLGKMFDKLIGLEELEGGHKGRIKAVEKELETRIEAAEPKRGRKVRNGENSKDIIAVDKMQENIELAERLYSDGMPYEIDRIENEIRFYQDQAGQSLIEMGKRFIRIKAHEDYGRFMRAIENVGMTDRSVRYAMVAARKFSDRKSISDLGSTKMIALSVLDDDSIQTLEDGGEIKGVTLDDVERMTTRELREALRKERDKRKKTEEVAKEKIRQKDEQITMLEFENENRQPLTKEQLAGAKLDEYLKPFNNQLQDAIFAMNRGLEIITFIQRIQAIGYVQLNDWVLKQSEDIANLKDTFNELQDAINDIHIDRLEEAEDPEAV
jgi:hypothetical protein